MREILFRGKEIKTGEWVYGGYIETDFIRNGEDKPYYTDHRIIVREASLDGHSFKVDPETVGQYTGLTDKNGKKIFEGDILIVVPAEQSKNNINLCDYVKFENGCFCMANAMMFAELSYGVSNYTVIGNIHDNTEFLKKE